MTLKKMKAKRMSTKNYSALVNDPDSNIVEKILDS
jgi:hypothetical protein